MVVIHYVCIELDYRRNALVMYRFGILDVICYLCRGLQLWM